MAQPLSATSSGVSGPPTAAGRPSGLMVMALRAAEQHVLVVLGEADVQTAEQLRTELIDRLPVQPPSVLVELGALEFCDLAGLDALRDAARAAHYAGIALTFRGMSAQLSWLSHAFPPPRVPPPSTPGTSQDVPATSAATPGTPASRLPATPGYTPSAAPGPARSADLTDGNTVAEARRNADVPSEFLTGRGRGHRGAPDGLAHAVPASDRTRSAICGARTWLATTVWTGAGPGSCPDCAAAVAVSPAVSTVHPFPPPGTAAGMHRQPQHQSLARQVS